ncbi:MAG: CPBP family intramembrane metalloprotease [Bacteroidales bacterium]|nr:MAG: CPBP family intramembrane metalloprotease [Bacteroidales bacterium]
MYSVLSILSVLGFFLIQGASEEIFMRGWFMQSIAVRHWPWLGIVLSTVIFTVLHAANPNLNTVAVVNLFLIGLFLAILALYDENLWGACGFHSAWNFTMNSVYGVQVSGNKLTGETIMQTTFEGNDLITGGGFGLEGSFVVTVIIVIATVLLIVLRSKR